MVAKVLSASSSAGFNTRGVSWDQYALTQARAIFHYIRLALIPIGQSIDHDFPLSRTPFEYHAWIFLAALLITAAAAYYFRHQYPLASFGVFAFLILLAPTSSIVPIADPFAERRMYLPLLALLLIVAEALRRYRLSIPVGVFVIALLSFLTYQRNRLWADPVAFWLDTVKHSPNKGRPHTHLAYAAVTAHQCPAIAPVFDEALQRMPNDYHVLTGYAKILECVGQTEGAASLLQHAAKVRPSAEVYELLGLLYGEMQNTEASRLALEAALRINPDSASAHWAMGLWYQSAQDLTNAANSYRRVLEIEPFNRPARAALRAIEANGPGDR
jgi:tetratricopeptide (TPR) repeat protein